MKVPYLILATLLLSALTASVIVSADQPRPDDSYETMIAGIEHFVASGTPQPDGRSLSDGLTRLEAASDGLDDWIRTETAKAWDAYDKALGSSVDPAEIRRLMRQADRFQAVSSCRFGGGCSRLVRIEEKNRIGAVQPDPKASEGWYGTWRVRSHHRSGPSRGGSFKSNFTVMAAEDGNVVIWNQNRRWPCTLSGNSLHFIGRHSSGGTMSWTLVRDGGTLVQEKSTFQGIINGQWASGTYEGRRQ